MKLVVVESPNKIEKIQHYLGEGYRVLATAGHFRDLPKHTLGVDKATFEPDYIVDDEKEHLVSRLRKAAKEADEVLLATDADREGEAISWHLSETLHLRNPKRMRFVEITEKALKAAVAAAGPLDQHLVDAQQARRVVDRLVGYEVSPLLFKFGKKHSAGRVQSATLHLVVEREKAIDAFQKKPFWTLSARYDNGLVATYATAKSEGDNAVLTPTRLDSEAEAQAVAARARGPHVVKSVETKPIERKPKAPFTTSTLQQAASVGLGLKPEATMALAQKLFANGFITYHRSDSVALSDDASRMARDFLSLDYPEALPAEAPRYAAKGNAQEAHEAIRPTSLAPDAAAGIPGDELELYQLIRNRFLASQCKPAVFDQTTVAIESGDTTWRAQGSVLRFPSFLRYLDSDEDTEKKPDGDAEARMPGTAQGDVLGLVGVEVRRNETKPPTRFTQATLIREMERVGIGRPSTYASTIAVLFSRDYVAEEKKYVLPTGRGRLIDGVLSSAFVDLVQSDYTADMESRLDEVAEGKRHWKDEVRGWYSGFEKLLAAAPGIIDAELLKHPGVAAEAAAAGPKLTDKPCLKCGALLRQFDGKKGPFLACSAYKKDGSGCDYVTDVSAQVSEYPCPKCAKRMEAVTGKFGAYARCLDKSCGGTKDLSAKPSDKPCLKCAGATEERTGKNGPYLRCVQSSCGHMQELTAVSSLHPCPKCGKAMAEQDGKFGRYARCLEKECGTILDLAPAVTEPCPVCKGPMKNKGEFYSCARYPECKGSLDVKALAKAKKAGKTCPKCQRMLVEKKGPKGKFWGCSGYPECKFIEAKA